MLNYTISYNNKKYKNIYSLVKKEDPEIKELVSIICKMILTNKLMIEIL